MSFESSDPVFETVDLGYEISHELRNVGIVTRGSNSIDAVAVGTGGFPAQVLVAIVAHFRTGHVLVALGVSCSSPGMGPIDISG